MNFIKKYIASLLTIILIPILINIFTNIFNWNDIWNNGWIILFLMSLIILIPFIIYFFNTQSKINENDKIVFSSLMNVINETDIDYILRDMSSNIPISDQSLRPILKFLNDSSKTKNIIHNKNLKKLLFKFQISLKLYSDKRGLYTFPIDRGGETFYGFDSEFKNNKYSLYEQRVNELDELASTAYTNYRFLIEYAKSKDLNFFTNKTINKNDI